MSPRVRAMIELLLSQAEIIDRFRFGKVELNWNEGGLTPSIQVYPPKVAAPSANGPEALS